MKIISKTFNKGLFIRRVILYFSIILLLIFFIAPLYGIITLSFKSLSELGNNYWGLPREWRIENFIYAWNNPTAGLKYYFFNTFKITIPSVIIPVFLSALAAYPLAKLKVKGEKVILIIIILGLTIPHQILIVPVFKILNLFYLYDTTLGLVWIHSAFSIPFCTFVLRNFMVQIPNEIEDASKIDGCNDLGSFWRVILPISKPALAVLFILQFTWVYNDFFYSLILTHSRTVAPITVALAIQKGSQYSVRWELLSASAIIASLPTIIVFLIFQRYFIKGIMLGAVKG